MGIWGDEGESGQALDNDRTQVKVEVKVEVNRNFGLLNLDLLAFALSL